MKFIRLVYCSFV